MAATTRRKYAHRPIQHCATCNWFDSGEEFTGGEQAVPCPCCGKTTTARMGRFIDTIRTYLFGLINLRIRREVEWWFDPVNEVPPGKV